MTKYSISHLLPSTHCPLPTLNFVTIVLLSSFLFSWSEAATKMRRVDERRAARVGLRRIDGRHLRLYTDLPPSDAVDTLGNVFDAAVEDWAAYFGVPPERTANWRMQGFLMQDRVKFRSLGLLPETKPDFVNGYCQGSELWLVEQPSDYYRRHLLLHEGTHGFMYEFVGEQAPGWYMEGMAELLGTHRWKDGQLTMRLLPEDRQQTPMWGRIKLVRESKPLPLEGVLALRQGRALSTDDYAWCWALCKFLDAHPHWGDTFRQAPKLVGKREFNARFRALFGDPWQDLQFEWQAFVAALDYGFDLQRAYVQHAPKLRTPRSDAIEISAEHGWQSTGWLLRRGQTYRLSSSGRFTIANDGQPWPCEPGGVTIEYHDGQPLGMLLGILRPQRGSADFSQLLPLGLKSEIIPETDSILYLRVNESAARLSDNQGELEVRVERISSAGGDD